MGTVAEVIDSRTFSEFCGVDSSNQVPDGDTLGRFRNPLMKSNLQEKLFAQVMCLLTERGLILKKGTIVDSTIISAPSSTKNKDKQRDPDAHQTKKGNTWHFGYKAHVGVDKDSGIVHTVKVTAANEHECVHDLTALDRRRSQLSMATADIWAQKSVRMPSGRISMGIKSAIRSTAVPLKSRRNPLVPKVNSSAENTKSHPSEPR